MAQLWLDDATGLGWCVLPLGSAALTLAAWPPRVRAESAHAGDASHDVRLVPISTAEGTVWSLLVGALRTVHVGGQPVALGLRALADRDEIRIEGVGTMFFSTETLAMVEPFPHTDRDYFCARCKLQIRPGDPAVRCPGCGVWHHQGERECWTYAPKCAMCDYPTALDAGFRWTPEDL